METSPSSDSPLIILNPTANRGNTAPLRTFIRSRQMEEQIEYVETSLPGEARERALLAAQSGRAIIVVGGDGTVHEVVNGILSAGRRVPLGIVPAGSGNDYACNTLHLPRDPVVALERALHGTLIDVDAGCVNGRYFANSFSVGLDADIGAAATSMKKVPFLSGARLYYTATLRQLLFGYHRCPWLKFRLDGNDYIHEAEKHYLLIAVTNGTSYGAGFRIAPDADHTDGLFDVCAIDYLSLFRAISLLSIVQKGEHASVPEVTFYRAKTISIESRQPVTIQTDGEISSATSFNAEILPGALWIRM